MGSTKTEQLASLKKMSRKVKVNNMKLAATRHGRKYGYSFQKAPPKTFGKRSLGLDSTPPIRGLHEQIQHPARWKIDKIWYPRVAPVAHTAGIKAKPSARLVESVNSPMALFITPSGKRMISDMHMHRRPCYLPILPFKRPQRHRLFPTSNQYGWDGSWRAVTYLITRPQKVREKPKHRIDTTRPNNPTSMTGFRPTWSERRLQ